MRASKGCSTRCHDSAAQPIVTGNAQPSTAIGVEIPIGSFLAIQLHGDVLAPLTQITLRLNDRDVWTTPVVSGSLGASLAGTF